MRGKAMKKIVKGLNLKGVKALEVFAREGDWQCSAYADKCKSLECWEINPEYKAGLHKNLPKAKIKICDSIKQIDKCRSRFDFIVVDNPQNIYGKYCEHFEVIPKIAKILSKNGILVFNVNIKPFGKNPKWDKRRKKFYGIDAKKLNLGWLELFYWDLFYQAGYMMSAGIAVKRNDYLYYLIYKK
jgi:hypothetical protein